MKFHPVSRLSKANPVKSHEFTSHPNSVLLCEVVMHSTAKGMNAFYHSRYKDAGDVHAFCEASELTDNDRIVARMHFAADSVSVPLIAHEVFHAVTCCRIHHRFANVTPENEEFMAETTGHIFNEVMKLVTHLKIKLDPLHEW